MNNEFPRRLRRLREKKRVSRRVLSELCGLSKNMVARYERGERVPSLPDAEVLADFFGVSLCQRRCDFVVFRRTGNVEKWRVKVYSS